MWLLQEAIIYMLNVFSADHTDLEWMYKLFIRAANKGHFVFPNNKTNRHKVKHDFYSIVSQHQRANSQLRAQTMIFENSEGKVGYIIMSEIESALGGNEVYVFIVDDKVRGNGYGKKMLAEISRRWHPLTDIYVRCLPASKAMAKMLLNAGFVNQGKTPEGADIYRLDKMQPLHYAIS